jgi:hypothetical protein
MDAAARATGATSPVPNTDGAYFTGLINMAGRQRMLSQRIGLILMIAAGAGSDKRQDHAEALNQALALFETSYELIVTGRTAMPRPWIFPAWLPTLPLPCPATAKASKK